MGTAWKHGRAWKHRMMSHRRSSPSACKGATPRWLAIRIFTSAFNLTVRNKSPTSYPVPHRCSSPVQLPLLVISCARHGYKKIAVQYSLVLQCVRSSPFSPFSPFVLPRDFPYIPNPHIQYLYCIHCVRNALIAIAVSILALTRLRGMEGSN
jgi:hypothetical protein